MTLEALQRIEEALLRADEVETSIRTVPVLDLKTFPVCVERADLRALLEERRAIITAVEAWSLGNSVSYPTMKLIKSIVCAAPPTTPSPEETK